ncbi:MAG TPA: HAD-IA family hydrolase [Motiliproteus sp.]
MDSFRRAVLFDLDGTLVDTAPDFYACINRLRAEEQLPPLDYDTVRAEVSNGGSALIRLGFGLDRNAPEFQPLLQRLLQLYSDHIADHSTLFAGMGTLLHWLEQQDWPWGVVTNKPERFAKPLLQQLGLTARCRVLICPEQVAFTKPDPEGVLNACSQLNCAPADSIYIGDHERDIQAGINGGLMTAVALFGYLEPSTEPQHWGADYLASTPDELLHWLQSLAAHQPLTGHTHV